MIFAIGCKNEKAQRCLPLGFLIFAFDENGPRLLGAFPILNGIFPVGLNPRAERVPAFALPILFGMGSLLVMAFCNFPEIDILTLNIASIYILKRFPCYLVDVEFVHELTQRGGYLVVDNIANGGVFLGAHL